MSYYDAAYSTRATVDNTKYYTQDLVNRKVAGAFVECGVGAGAQLGAMQNVLGVSRWVYGFDSFEGIPLASRNDDVQPGFADGKTQTNYSDPSELLKSSGITVCDEPGVRRNLNRWAENNNSTNVILVKGWFQNTLKLYRQVFEKLGGIALLRLDGDLYESTKVSLEELFPHLNDGGILIIDDWKLTGCKLACEQYFMRNSVCRISPPHGSEDDGPAYFIKQSVRSLKYRHNEFSQNGEDGILQELLRRMEDRSQWVCEFGAWDGKECSNTFRLVKRGYNGVYIEGRADYYKLLQKTCEEYSNIHPIHTMVDYEGDNTLDNILAETPIPTDFDILSIDIDSYDYQVWRSVEVYTPKIVVIEINSSISPIDETHIHSSEKEGTGYFPMVQLGESKGYTLVCHTGNLIFVRNDLAGLYPDLVMDSSLYHRTSWIFNNPA